MKKSFFSTEDYIFIKDIKHLLRPGEEIIFISKTETNYTKFITPGDIAKYVIIGTQYRIIIVAKSKLNEFSTSFSFSELGTIIIIKGFLHDKVKIHHYIFKLKKSSSKQLSKISKFLNIKLSIWKYPLFFISLTLLIIFFVKGYNYFRYFFILPELSSQSQSNSNQSHQPSNQTVDIDKILRDIISGYEYTFKQIINNYPIYIKNPSIEGEPYSRFDEWILKEIIINLDSQDNKLASLKISLEKHILIRLGISNLRASIMEYIDNCKKSFLQKKIINKLPHLQNNIEKQIKDLKEILK